MRFVTRRSGVLALCLPLFTAHCAKGPTALERARRASPTGSAAAAGSVARPVTATVTRGWALGQEYPYRLGLTTSVALGDQPSFVDFDLKGDLLVIPTSIAEEQTTLFVAVRNAKLVARSADPDGRLQQVAEQVSATGMLLTLKNGRTSELRIASDLSPLTVGIYRELGARLQFASARDGSAKYEIEEYDGTGKYTAAYSRDDDAGLRFHKRKLRYSSVLGTEAGPTNGPGKIVPNILASEGAFTLSPEGRPLQVDVRDEVILAGAQNPVRSKTSVTLAAGDAVPGQQHDFASMAEHLVRLGADEAYGAKTPVAALDSARIHGLTYDKVLARLTELKKSYPTLLGDPATAEPSARAQGQAVMQEVSSLFMALAAIFRQQPDTIARAQTSIRSGSALTETLLDSLGSSGSSAAHLALGEIARSPKLDAKVRRRALTALARTSSPSAASVSALESVLADEPFDSTALYGLGTYARRFRDAGQKEQADKIAELLGERLQRAGTIGSRVELVLGAIANSGNDALLRHVAPRLSDPSETVRAMAVRALQSMHDPQVDTLIAARMAGDSASGVRIAAMEAARGREPSELCVRALNRVSTSDADPRVRYRGVELLVQWLPKRADLRSTLQRIAAKDPEAQVRSRAQAAL